jgi:hypothetical protein
MDARDGRNVMCIEHLGERRGGNGCRIFLGDKRTHGRILDALV